MRNFENYEVDENEYIEIHDTYCDEWSLDTYEENDFEVDCEEVVIKYFIKIKFIPLDL